MLNDTPDLDVDAPIEYVLTELGRQTVRELARKYVCVKRMWDCHACDVCDFPNLCGPDDGEG